jgi:hypothetical protein
MYLQVWCIRCYSRSIPCMFRPILAIIRSFLNFLYTQLGYVCIWFLNVQWVDILCTSYKLNDQMGLHSLLQGCLLKIHDFFKFLAVGWDWVHSVSRPVIGLLYQPQMIDDDECETVGGMRNGRGNRSTRRKLGPGQFRQKQIPHVLPRDITWAYALGGRWLTAWAMAHLIHGMTQNPNTCKTGNTDTSHTNKREKVKLPNWESNPRPSDL